MLLLTSLDCQIGKRVETVGQIPSRLTTRATVVWVQALLPRGVGTPRSISARASPWWVMMPIVRSTSTSSASRWAT